ncbi:homeobox protein koza-like [Oscarella lobularis]|uniref:homeobox protein koza-like n=1 Tax=Oscarella lobularis TaxID=121494 RepID=UPI003313AD2F
MDAPVVPPSSIAPGDDDVNVKRKPYTSFLIETILATTSSSAASKRRESTMTLLTNSEDGKTTEQDDGTESLTKQDSIGSQAPEAQIKNHVLSGKEHDGDDRRDDNCQDDNSDSSAPVVKTIKPLKKPRTTFTDHQITELERLFNAQKYLSSIERHDVARLLNLTETQIKTWFQNRRMKFKRQHSERELQAISSHYAVAAATAAYRLNPYPAPMRMQRQPSQCYSHQPGLLSPSNQRFSSGIYFPAPVHQGMERRYPPIGSQPPLLSPIPRRFAPTSGAAYIF